MAVGCYGEKTISNKRAGSVIIQEVMAKDDFILSIVAEDGVSGEFKKIHNGRYFVEWACGADLSADTIEAHLK